MNNKVFLLSVLLLQTSSVFSAEVPKSRTRRLRQLPRVDYATMAQSFDSEQEHNESDYQESDEQISSSDEDLSDSPTSGGGKPAPRKKLRITIANEHEAIGSVKHAQTAMASRSTLAQKSLSPVLAAGQLMHAHSLPTHNRQLDDASQPNSQASLQSSPVTSVLARMSAFQVQSPVLSASSLLSPGSLSFSSSPSNSSSLPTPSLSSGSLLSSNSSSPVIVNRPFEFGTESRVGRPKNFMNILANQWSSERRRAVYGLMKGFKPFKPQDFITGQEMRRSKGIPEPKMD